MCPSLRELDEVEVIEGHLVAVATENEHKSKLVHAGGVTIACLGFPVSLKACNTAV